MRQKSRASAAVIVLIVVAISGVIGGAAASRNNPGFKFYAPSTWFSHKPADKVDQAAARVDSAKDATVHAATIEADKANRAAQKLPPSQEAGVVQRFTGNTFGLLNGVSPITVQETDSNTAILVGLLSKEVAARAKAEALQAQSDAERDKIATEYQKAVKAKSEAEIKLRQAFDKENQLADELRSENARRVIYYAIGIILLLAILYMKIVLGKVGAAFHLADQIMPSDKTKQVIGFMDGEISKVGQWLISSGRKAAAKAHAEAKELVDAHT